MKEELTPEAQEALEEILSPSRQAVLEIAEPLRRPAPDFGWTRGEFAEHIGMSAETARRWLEAAVSEGKLEKKVLTCPRQAIIYYPPGTWPK